MHLHPDPVVTYIIERNINYTNSCVTYCRFCAFYRRPGHAEVYVLSHEELGKQDLRAASTTAASRSCSRAATIPDLPLTWYEEMLRFIKARVPDR